jgi:hypothetical protein
VALFAVEDAGAGADHCIKRLRTRQGRHWLDSDNPAHAARPAEGATLVARLARSFSPASLGPAVGVELPDVAAAFGLAEPPTAPWSRVDGHLFLLAEGVGVLDAPDRWVLRVPGRGPSETAFVLTRPGPGAPWVHRGVGRWLEGEGAWCFGALPFEDWRRLTRGRGSSCTLSAAWEEEAARLAEQAVARLRGELCRHRGSTFRVVGRAPGGGIRLDGGAGGFRERTVSRADLAWVLAAEADTRSAGGALDEARVNRLRYLDGTPRGATRWDDTRWALAVLGELRARSG